METITQLGNETKTTVSIRHREEWQSFRAEIMAPALESGSDGQAKFAKTCADILKIYQEGERKAWGFADNEVDEDQSLEVIMQE